MTLSQVAILLGAALAIPQVWVLMKPEQAGAALRKFPRSEGWGYLLMAIGAGWFLYRLNQEAIAEFATYKTYMLLGFGGVAVAACFFCDGLPGGARDEHHDADAVRLCAEQNVICGDAVAAGAGGGGVYLDYRGDVVDDFAMEVARFDPMGDGDAGPFAEGRSSAPGVRLVGDCFRSDRL